ncbi:MAG: antirestriction protein ArdA [Kordiimonadaceae bacterium]|nr:antirestriction protein ArdA [Kordiimonadaceae bacterium]
MDEDELIKSIYLADDQGCTMDQVLSQLEDVVLFEGTAEEYAENYIEETGLLDEMPENLRYYFNTEAFARDMILNGDITELTIEGTTYIVWGC